MNTLKHYISTEDFNKETYLELFRRADIFEKGIATGKSFTDLAKGKIMAVMFFQESTRTVAAFQAAMIRLGGGWLGIPNPAGSYVAIGEEAVEPTLEAIAPMADIMCVRHKNFDLATITPYLGIPVINAMCGGEEHTAGGLWFSYMISKRFADLSKVKVGFYGMAKSSRPTKAMMKVLSQLGVTIYEDPIIPQFETPAHIREYIERNGAKRIVAPYQDFIGVVDLFFVVEGLPQPGEDENLVKEYNKKVKIIDKEDLARLRSDAYMEFCEPSMLTDGRETMKRNEVIHDPRILNAKFMAEAVYANMALTSYLLGIDVK